MNTGPVGEPSVDPRATLTQHIAGVLGDVRASRHELHFIFKGQVRTGFQATTAFAVDLLGTVDEDF